jgi:dTDP-glucose 4,6-dehydratase
MDRVLVTGGAGFIGSNFVRHLINETNSKVINLDKLTYAGNLKNIKEFHSNKAHTFVKGDIRNRNLADSLVEKVDAVVNFAAESHVDRSLQTPRVFVQTNILGTQVLLDACRRFRVPFQQLILSSTKSREIHASTLLLCWVGIPLLRFHLHHIPS